MLTRYRISPFLFFAILTATFGFPVSRAEAQAAGSITGQVRIYPGNVINAPVIVSVEGHGSVVTTTYTDNEGRFGVNGLPPGQYHVVVKEDAYQPVDEVVRIDSVTSSTVALVNIYLRPRESKEPPAAPLKGANTQLITPAEYVRKAPKGARKEFQKATDLEKNGQSDDAIRHYRKAIEIYPDFYAARNNLGAALMSRAQYGEAQQQFEKVIALNATDGASYFNLANLYLITKQAEQAQIWVERGLARQPDSALGQFLQGSLYELTGRFKEAETSLRRSIELDPLMAKAHLALVNLYIRTKREEQAVSELRAFLTAFPNDPFAPKAKQVLKRLEDGSAVHDPLVR
jgi:tetratricopeptide (TPR) repeat protein